MLFNKKVSVQVFSCNFCQIIQISFVRFINLSHKIEGNPRPCFFCFTLNIFTASTIDHMQIAVSESPRKQAMAELIYY